jgi:hypothetical protein
MKLIGLTGQAGAGKDTVADFLCETEGFVAIPFLDPIEIQRLREAPEYLHVNGIVIRDVRLPYDFAWIRDWGGEIWHILRGEIYSMSAEEYRASRAGLSGDRIIYNNCTIEVLHELIHTIITIEEEAS